MCLCFHVVPCLRLSVLWHRLLSGRDEVILHEIVSQQFSSSDRGLLMKYGKGLKVLALYGFSTWLWGAEQTEVALPVDPLCLSCGSISVSPTSVSNATVELSPTSASSATVELSPTSASSVTVELSPASASSATLQPIVEEQSSELPGLLTPIPELPNTHTGFLSGKGLAGGVDNIMILE